MVDLPPLPVTQLAIHIAINGMAMWFLMPSLGGFWRKQTIYNFIGLMAFAISAGLFISNLTLWFIMWAATPGVR